MDTQLDDQLRQLLHAEAEAAKISSNLWDRIETRLDREPLRAVPIFRLPIDRPWRAAVAVCSVAAALWFCVVPDQFISRVQAASPAPTVVTPVVRPYKGEVVKAVDPTDQLPELTARHGGLTQMDVQ